MSLRRATVSKAALLARVGATRPPFARAPAFRYALVAVAITSVALLLADPGAPAEAQGSGTVQLLAIDMDTVGNTVADPPSGNVEETALGTIDDCVEVTHPAAFDVDVVVSGYPPDTNPLVAYDIIVSIPEGLQMTDSITGNVIVLARTLLSGDPQSGPTFFTDIDEPNYGAGGPLAGPATHSAVALDFAPIDADESVDGEENSDGFLIRYTFATTSAGPAELPLTLTSNTDFVLDEAGGIRIAKVENGVVAVDKSCEGVEPPPGLTDVSPDGDTGADGDTPSGDDSSPAGPPAGGVGDTPPDSAGDGEGAGDGETPSDTDEAIGEGGAASPDRDDDSDGGIGTVGWIGIGLGVGGTALALLAGAAWMIRSRTRTGV